MWIQETGCNWDTDSDTGLLQWEIHIMLQREDNGSYIGGMSAERGEEERTENLNKSKKNISIIICGLY
jgi:hypothetical protein